MKWTLLCWMPHVSDYDRILNDTVEDEIAIRTSDFHVYVFNFSFSTHSGESAKARNRCIYCGADRSCRRASRPPRRPVSFAIVLLHSHDCAIVEFRQGRATEPFYATGELDSPVKPAMVAYGRPA